MKNKIRKEENSPVRKPEAEADAGRREMLKWGGFLLAAFCLPAVSVPEVTEFAGKIPEKMNKMMAEPEVTMIHTGWCIPH